MGVDLYVACTFASIFTPSQATGSRLGTLVETMIGLLLAVAISFAYNWVLTFVILGVVPFLMIAGALEVKALQGHSTKNKKALETSGKVRGRTYVCVYIHPCILQKHVTV